MSDPNLIDNNGKIRKIGREFDEHPLMSPKKLQTDGLEGLLDKAKTFTEWNLKDFYRVCEKEKCNKYGFEWLRSYGITVCCGSWQAGYCTERILKNSSLILAEDVVGFFKDRTFFEKETSLRNLFEELRKWWSRADTWYDGQHTIPIGEILIANQLREDFIKLLDGFDETFRVKVSGVEEKKESPTQQKFRCSEFGNANSSDACLQCPSNSECATQTCLKAKGSVEGQK